jgi:hypothetical protein
MCGLLRSTSSRPSITRADRLRTCVMVSAPLPSAVPAALGLMSRARMLLRRPESAASRANRNDPGAEVLSRTSG